MIGQCSTEIMGISISDETLEIMLLVSDLMVLICQKMKNQSKNRKKIEKFNFNVIEHKTIILIIHIIFSLFYF